MSEFVSEDDLETFENWLKYQGIERSSLDATELSLWQGIFQKVKDSRESTPKVGLMKLRSAPGEYRYGVAVADDTGALWLTLWVRRSPKGEFFVLMPRGDRGWDPHTSYHLDGTLHTKSHGMKLSTQKRQPPDGSFRGVVGLGTYYGHGPKSVGAACDPSAFSGLVVIPEGVLGPSQGGVSVDLVGRDGEALEVPWKRIVAREIYTDFTPNVVITVGCDHVRA